MYFSTTFMFSDKFLSLSSQNDILKAAIEEGVVVGGGCTLLRLSLKVDEIKEQLDNEEQKVHNVPFIFIFLCSSALNWKTALLSIMHNKHMMSIDDGYDLAFLMLSRLQFFCTSFFFWNDL